MTDHLLSTKAELLTTIESAWETLITVLEALTDQQMTSLHDAQGWTVKDHIVHLAAWERSVVFFLQGKPRSAGLNVDPALYRDGSYDEINAEIYERSKDLSLEKAMAELRDVHRQLMDLLQPLTDADLQKTYQQYVPSEKGDDRSALEVVYSNTTGHFADHLTWIERLVGNQAMI